MVWSRATFRRIELPRFSSPPAIHLNQASKCLKTTLLNLLPKVVELVDTYGDYSYGSSGENSQVSGLHFYLSHLVSFALRSQLRNFSLFSTFCLTSHDVHLSILFSRETTIVLVTMVVVPIQVMWVYRLYYLEPSLKSRYLFCFYWHSLLPRSAIPKQLILQH